MFPNYSLHDVTSNRFESPQDGRRSTIAERGESQARARETKRHVLGNSVRLSGGDPRTIMWLWLVINYDTRTLPPLLKGPGLV